MKSLTQFIKESLLTEGGHVFAGGSDPIKKEYIKGTIDKFVSEFTKIFPKVKNHFENPQTLGSVGKKDVSGDIDLAIDDECLTNLDDWGLDKDKFDSLVQKFTKRARSATPKQIARKAAITLIAEIINNKSNIIKVDDKGAGNGMLFCQFPQYDGNKELDLTVQIDINFGNVDWLTFAYYSDFYEGNIKGLHRTQLMLHLFSNKNYSFNHNFGVKNKDTGEIEATNREDAIKILNKLYNFNITDKILQNYHKLHEYIKEHLSEKDLHDVYDIYLKTLDSTRCDIPDDLQTYWLENQDRLGLKGKFLPDDSRLFPYKK